MVILRVSETKAECDHSLDGLKRLAGFKQVQFMYSRVTRDVSNLGMDLDDVCDRLVALQIGDFQHSERYEDDLRWHDVYVLPNPRPANAQERLYIKFRVSRDCVWIELCSFHLDRWL